LDRVCVLRLAVPSRNVTVPVGLTAPVPAETVAVKVTDALNDDGLELEVTVTAAPF
jgi:hypothetical protein